MHQFIRQLRIAGREDVTVEKGGAQSRTPNCVPAHTALSLASASVNAASYRAGRNFGIASRSDGSRSRRSCSAQLGSTIVDSL